MVDARKVLITLAILIGAAVVQSTLLPRLIRGAHPDFMLAITASAGLVGGPWVGGIIGLLCGLMVDLLTGRLVGLTMVTLGIAGAVSGRLAGRLYKENPFVPFVIGAAATVINHLLFILGARAFGFVIPFGDSLINIIFPSIWYNGLLTALTFPGVYRLYHRIAYLESTRL